MASHRLGAADREFLAALADVVFGNPFTPELSTQSGHC